METLPVITAHELSIGYRNGKRGQKVIHRHLSLELYPGELTCLLGPNGVGKSTLLRTLSAFQPPLEGRLYLEGRLLASYSEKEKSRKIGVVLTDKTQAGGLTVYELIALGRQPHTGFWGHLDADDHRLIREAMEAVGITHKSQNYVAELSDGERQKVMIAKALVQECSLILLDEPTAFLDVTSRIEMMTLLHTIAREQGKTILLSTHDIDQALIQADRLWLLSARGLQSGVTEDLVFNGGLDDLFGHDKIRFDREHGIFSPFIGVAPQVVVKAADSSLWHWTVNALNRCGYMCLTADSGATDLAEVIVYSPCRMILNAGGNNTDFTSFEALIKALKMSNEVRQVI